MQQNKRKDSALACLFEFAGNFKYLTLISCILSGVSAILSLMPYVYIWFVLRDIFIYYPDLSQATNLTHYGWMAVLFAILSILVYFVALMCSHIAAFRTARNMRSVAVHHLMKLPMGYFSSQGSGRLRRIIDECAGQTEAFLAHRMPDLIGAIVAPLAMVVMLFTFDWKMGIVSLIPIFIGMAILMILMSSKASVERMKQYQTALEDMNNEAVEYVRGIPIVKTFGQTVFSFKNFYDSIMRYKDFVLGYTKNVSLPMNIFSVSINGIFAFLVPAGVLTIASVVNPKEHLLSLIFYVIFTPICTVMLNKIMFSSHSAMLAKDATERIKKILSQEPLKQAENPQTPNNGTVSLENVSFSYPEAKVPALKKVSFEIPVGSTYALVGPSGGGKTTAASLIPRFWDVSSGSVRIGGVDVRNMDTEVLMRHVSFVFQNTTLLKTSILENIKMGNNSATKSDVYKAIEAAQCQDIIEKLPNGMDTVVGTKGVYLSGGEAQRIALARAILKDAPIIVLDEATAFADPENEFLIQKALRELTKNKTVLMIAHRLSTVKNADKILVMSQGSVVEEGTHQELVAQNGLYSQMWEEYRTSTTWRVGKEKVCNG